MHRDQKIGLSLAVLVVGFAGAFCFRHEPLREPQTLALDQVSDLDSRIEHLPIRAYTQREGVGAIFAESELLKSTDDLVDLAAVDKPVDTMPAEDNLDGDVIELFAGPPEPVRTVEELTTVFSPASHSAISMSRPPTLVLPADVADFPSPKTSAAPGDDDPERSFDPGSSSNGNEAGGPTGTGEQSYVVTSGDTLSGISLRMYGTVARFHEIYEANRAVLSDPHNLPVGATLRIP